VAFGGEEGYGAQVMCSECWIIGDDEPSNSDLPKNVGNDLEVGIDENNEEEVVEKILRKRKAYTHNRLQVGGSKIMVFLR
jgi:hypothetical protein